MTVELFVKQNLHNYEERKNNLYRIHRNKSVLQWHIDKFNEAYLSFLRKNNINN